MRYVALLVVVATTVVVAQENHRGFEEIHEVENTGDAASEFLRVEVKTQGVAPETFRGKFERPAPASTVVTQFDHPQLRISRSGRHLVRTSLWRRPRNRFF